jgi:predicted homoserine dehydrogenase-like protein
VVAKRDLKAGETLDEYGMFMTYGEAVNTEEMSGGRYRGPGRKMSFASCRCA